jgi:hypothetical protein
MTVSFAKFSSRPGGTCLDRNNVKCVGRENLSPVHRGRTRKVVLYYPLQMCDVVVVYFERESTCVIFLSRTRLNFDKEFYKCDCILCKFIARQ